MLRGFFICPTTGKVIHTAFDDDKVYCGCMKSNPECPTEGAEETGTHRVAFLRGATEEEFDQWVKKLGKD